MRTYAYTAPGRGGKSLSVQFTATFRLAEWLTTPGMEGHDYMHEAEYRDFLATLDI